MKKEKSIILFYNKKLIEWQGVSTCYVGLLKSDGSAVIYQENGQVCILQLYDGNQRITLDELEAIENVKNRSQVTEAQTRQQTQEAEISQKKAWWKFWKK